MAKKINGLNVAYAYEVLKAYGYRITDFFGGTYEATGEHETVYFHLDGGNYVCVESCSI